jgi:hypothetical protein
MVHSLLPNLSPLLLYWEWSYALVLLSNTQQRPSRCCKTAAAAAAAIMYALALLVICHKVVLLVVLPPSRVLTLGLSVYETRMGMIGHGQSVEDP